MNATPMARPLLIIVNGAPASGKSTLAEQVAAQLGVPFLSKDTFKEELYDSLGVLGVIERTFFRKLGEASMRVMYRVAGSILDAGVGVVLEANFYRGVSEQDLSSLLGKAHGVMIHCEAPEETLKERYVKRAEAGERHPVHDDSNKVDKLEHDLEEGTYEPLDLDLPVIRVSTAEDYDPSIAEIVSRLREAVGAAPAV
jgi:predicted kinase